MKTLKSVQVRLIKSNLVNQKDKNFRLENLKLFNNKVFQVEIKKIGSFLILIKYFQKTLKI